MTNKADLTIITSLVWVERNFIREMTWTWQVWADFFNVWVSYSWRNNYCSIKIIRQFWQTNSFPVFYELVWKYLFWNHRFVFVPMKDIVRFPNIQSFPNSPKMGFSSSQICRLRWTKQQLELTWLTNYFSPLVFRLNFSKDAYY